MAAGEAMVGPGENPAPLRDRAVGAGAVLLLGAVLALDVGVLTGPWAGFIYVVPFLVVVVGLPRIPPLAAALVAVLASAAGLLLSSPGAPIGAFAAGNASWVVAAGVPGAIALAARAASWLLVAGVAVAVDRRRGTGGPVRRENPYRVLFREHDAAVLVIDPADGAIVDANPAAARLFGVPPDALCGMEVADPAGAPEPGRRLSRQRKPVRCVLRFGTGEERVAEVVVVPVTADGRDLLYATIHDVTAEHRAGRAIRDGEAQLRRVVDALPGGLVLCGALADGSLRVLDLNAGGERLLGRARDGVIGQDPDALLGELCPSRPGAFGRVLETGRAETLAVDGPGGDRFELRLFRPGPGRVAGLAVDMTARYRAEAELRRSSSHLEQSVLLACCDLREPLWTIASFAELVRHRAGDGLDAEDREALDYVRGAVRRLESRVGALARDARIEGRALLLEPVDLADALARAGAGPEMVGTDGPLPPVLADRGLLAEALAELFAGAVAVSAGCEDGLCRVRVAGGRGADLGTAARIVERHGGTLRVEHGPGGETVVSFTLPVADTGIGGE